MDQGVEPAPVSVPSDLCLRCGYDLRGIADDQPCSECGLLAERSRNRSEHLADAPPWLIRRLALGAALLLWAVFAISGYLLLLILSELFFGHTVSRIILPWMTTMLAVTALLWVIGAWLLTTRGTPTHAANMSKRLGRAWRVSSLLPLLLLADSLADSRWNTHGRLSLWVIYQFSDAWEMWVQSAIYLFGTFLFWLILSLNSVLGFLWLRRLARRVLNANLAEHSAIVGVGFALSSGLLVLYAITSSWLERNQPFANKTWMLLSVALIAAILACVITCALWSLLNLIRFTLAFRRAALDSRDRWHAADRAADGVS